MIKNKNDEDDDEEDEIVSKHTNLISLFFLSLNH